MAPAFQQSLVVLVIALTLAMSDSTTPPKRARYGLFKGSPQLPPAGGEVVNTTSSAGLEKVGRHVRPLERPPWDTRPAERPMSRHEVPKEVSREMTMPGAPFAEPKQLPQDDLGADNRESRMGISTQPPKPGQCPVTECRGDQSITNKQDCRSDNHCPGSEKCCPDPCRHRLVCSPAGYHVHPGHCPTQESCVSSPYDYKVVCNNDVECSSDQKCCYDLCIGRYVCKPIAGQPLWPPLPEPVWPPIDPIWPLPPGPDPPRPDKCSYYCPGSVRCCDHMMRPGYCPSPALCYDPQEESVLTPYLSYCESDFGCSRTDKCCFDQCRRKMVCRPTVYDSKAHPGQCPAPAIRCEQAQVKERTPCTDDRSCSLHERCCSSPCYRTLVCTAALNGLPPPPVIPRPTGPDPNQCVTYCPGTKRCCDGVEKNGFCPGPSKCVGALISPLKTCSHDYDCEGGDKCCQDSCSTLHVCRPAVSSPTVHPGVCPATTTSCVRPFVQSVASQPQPNDCSQDMECTMEQRCCLDRCKDRMTCQYTNHLQPLPPSLTHIQCNVYCPGSNVCCDEGEKENYCPAPASCAGAYLNPPPRCLKDYDCSDTDKCCLDNCHNQYYCRPAVSHEAVHPGSCPPAPSTCAGYNAQNKNPCDEDRDCRFEQRCCFDGCSNRRACLPAKNTTNPDPPPPPPPEPTCKVYCPGSKVCCDEGEKEDFCPAPALCVGALLNPPSRCLKDYDCSDTDKCCLDNCHNQYYCRPAVSHEAVHPGSCPPAPSTCAGYNAQNKKSCARDGDCRFEQRCCFDGCLNRRTCLVTDTPEPDPSTCSFYCPGTKECCDDKVKVGYCPATSVCGGAYINPPPRCTVDHQCPGEEKCCHDVCERNLVCRAAVTSPRFHPGECPAQQSSCPTTIKQQAKCAADRDCRYERRCCHDVCHQHHICKVADTSSTPPLPGCSLPCPHDASICCDTMWKSGYCPGHSVCPQSVTSIGLLNPPTVCQGADYSCPGMEKCCYDNCQMKLLCRPSVSSPYDHLGQCPLVQAGCIALKPSTTMECGNDSYCLSDERCCPDTCERKAICKKASANTSDSASAARRLQ